MNKAEVNRLVEAARRRIYAHFDHASPAPLNRPELKLVGVSFPEEPGKSLEGTVKFREVEKGTRTDYVVTFKFTNSQWSTSGLEITHPG